MNINKMTFLNKENRMKWPRSNSYSNIVIDEDRQAQGHLVVYLLRGRLRGAHVQGGNDELDQKFATSDPAGGSQADVSSVQGCAKPSDPAT